MIVSYQLGPLQEQVLLTAEPFLHPPIIMFFWNIGSHFVAQAVLNLLWSPTWFQSHGDPPASASQVLRLQEFAAQMVFVGLKIKPNFRYTGQTLSRLSHTPAYSHFRKYIGISYAK